MEATSAGKLPRETGRAGQKAAGVTWSSLTAIWRRWLPRTIQLCVQCRENPARFWVSRQGDRTARRPWCLSCSDGLDLGRCDVIPLG